MNKLLRYLLCKEEAGASAIDKEFAVCVVSSWAWFQQQYRDAELSLRAVLLF